MGFLARIKKALAAFCCCNRKDKEIDYYDDTAHQPGADRDWPVATVAVKSISCPNLASPVTSSTQPRPCVNGDVMVFNFVCFECCQTSRYFWLDNITRTHLSYRNRCDFKLCWCENCGSYTPGDVCIGEYRAKFVWNLHDAIH